MEVKRQRAISLGIKEGEGGTRQDGSTYEPYTALNFATFGDTASKSYIDRKNTELLGDVRTVCSKWGCYFRFDGQVDTKGKITIEHVYSDSDSSDEIDIDLDV